MIERAHRKALLHAPAPLVCLFGRARITRLADQLAELVSPLRIRSLEPCTHVRVRGLVQPLDDRNHLAFGRQHRRLTARVAALLAGHARADLCVPARDRVVELGVHQLAGWCATRLRRAAETVVGAGPLLALHPDLVQASSLVPLLNLDGKPGFVVVDMADVDEFGPTMALPDPPVYVVDGLDRGDAMSNWSPAEADPAIAAAGRTPRRCRRRTCRSNARP